MIHDNYSISSRLVTIMQSISNTDDETLAKVSGCNDTKAFVNKRLRSGFSIEQLFDIAKCCDFEMDFIFKYKGIQIPLSSLKNGCERSDICDTYNAPTIIEGSNAE